MADTDAIAKQASKVAAISLSFWILKILTTTAGDLSGDLLSLRVGMGYVIALFVALTVMAALLMVQFSRQRFNCFLYWALILLSSTVGAEFSDSVDRLLHLGTPVGAAVLLACLVLTLWIWHLRGGRILYYPIVKRTDEVFYWIAAIFANGLGSVLGDLLADRLGFGVLAGVGINFAVLGVLTLLRYRTKAHKGVLFWAAFVFSRISL